MAAYSNGYTPYNGSYAYNNAVPNYSQTYAPSPYQQTMQQPQYQVQPTMNGFLTIPVDGERDAQEYPVGAGCEVMLISFKEGTFWIKGTAKNGIPNPLRAYSFREDTEQVQQNQNGSIYVTKDEFDSIRNKLNELIEKLGGDN